MSWAVVQRSQGTGLYFHIVSLLSTLLTGFLDGGDRTMMLSQARTPTACSTLDYGPFDTSHSPPGDICSPSVVQLQPEPPVSSAVPTLLVTNLPGVLFSQPADLHPLLCPFGDIEHLKIVTDETTAAQGKISVVVEYKTLGQAKDARDALSGQIYVDEPVKAELLYSNLPPVASQEANTWCPATGDMKTGLNPFAAPFHVQTTLAQARPMLPAPFCNEAQPLNRYEGLSKWSNDSPVSDSPYLSLPAFHSSVYSNLGLCAPQPTTLRPRSAPSEYVTFYEIILSILVLTPLFPAPPKLLAICDLVIGVPLKICQASHCGRPSASMLNTSLRCLCLLFHPACPDISLGHAVCLVRSYIPFN